MWLKMYIGNIFISKWEIHFEYCDSVEERESHAKKVAKEMYNHHFETIGRIQKQPVFYLHLSSKMNFYMQEDDSGILALASPNDNK